MTTTEPETGIIWGARVTREPFTYDRHTPVSYFRDLAVKDSDPAAAARIDRHEQEMRAVRADMDVRAARGLASEGFETRATPARASSNFAVPLWLLDEFATAPRAARVLASLAPHFDLPAGVSTVNIPRLTTGTSEGGTGDNQPVPQTDFVDAATTSNVATIDGKADVPLQMLEQSPAGAHLDWVLMQDMVSAYDQSLEQQLISGSGSGSGSDAQLQGLINLSGINKQTFTTATPFYCSSATATNNLNTYFGQAGAQIGDNRKMPPEALLMTTSRWLWIATSTDNQQRPIVPPDVHPPSHDGDGKVPAVSTLAGFAVYVDDAVPVTLGAASNQDLVLLCRPSDLLVFEGTPTTSVHLEVLSGTLQARIVYRNYAAAIVGRYPSGISWIQGTGMVVQSGY